MHCLSYFDLWLVITPQDLQTFLIIDTTSWVNAKNVSQCPMSTIWVRVVVFNATFNNISVILWRSVLLVEKTRVPGENHRPAASHWQSSCIGIRTHNVYHMGVKCQYKVQSHLLNVFFFFLLLFKNTLNSYLLFFLIIQKNSYHIYQ